MPLPPNPWLDPEEDDEDQPLDPLNAPKPPAPSDASTAEDADALQGAPSELPSDTGPGAPPGLPPWLQPGPSAVQQQGPPPTMPKPKVWQRVLAGLAGGAAGAMNVKAGYPGGPRKPIDASGAIAGIYGVPGYNRQMADWKNRVAMAEYQDKQSEQQRDANLRYMEMLPRNAYYGAIAGDLNAQRQAAALDKQRAYMQGTQWHDPSGTHQYRFDLNPVEDTTGLRQDMPQLPEHADLNPPNSLTSPGMPPMPSPAQESGLPASIAVQNADAPQGLVPNAYSQIPTPPWATPPKPGMQLFAQNPAETRAEELQQTAASRLEPVPADLQDYLGKTTATSAEIIAALRAANQRAVKPPAMTEGEAIRIKNDPNSTPEQRAMAEQILKDFIEQKKAERPITNNNNIIPGMPTAPNNLTGEAFLATLPIAAQSQVKAIAEGRATIPSLNNRSQGAQQMRSAVFQYDPSFSEQRAQIRKAFTTGPDGKNIGALNTAVVHLNELDQAADALGNGTFTPGNAAYNAISTWLGGAAPTEFNTIKAAVAGELANALKGNATDTEIKSMSENITAAASPAALKGAIARNLDILGQKLNTYHERYNQQIPGDSVWSPVLPAARQIFERHGITPGTNAQVKPPGPAPAGKIWITRNGQLGTILPADVKPGDIKVQ